MTTGLLGELTARANAWTTATTWWIFAVAACLALLCLLLRGWVFAGRLRAADAASAGDAWRGLAIAAGLFVAALALRLLWPERVHYTFNDEYEYVAHARRLLSTGEYRLWSGPPAGVWLYAIAFAVFGASNEVAFGVTIALASLTPPVLYWTLRVLRVERAVAAIAALLLVLAPLHVKHAASASLEIASLLCLLLVVGSFVELLRRPARLAALCFATSLFFALTMRVENWCLLLLLPLLAWLWRGEVRRPALAYVALAGLAIVLAAAYLPGILDAPIRYGSWWKSRLPGPSLLLTNLGFWVGGDVLLRKVPLLVGVVGVVAALRASPRACAFWIAFVLLYSVVFVLYGLNVGWLEEAHQPPPWGARGAGHDMFRFDLILLPAVCFALASGIVACARAAAALWRGSGVVRAMPRTQRMVALAAAGFVVVLLLAWRGEYRSYHPLAFVASPYNRAFEIAEYRFVRDSFADGTRQGTCYVLPPADGIVLGAVAVRPLEGLDADLRADAAAPAFVYVNGRQLAVPELRRAFVAVQERYQLREVARRVDGTDHFFLYAVAPQGAGVAPGGGSS